MSHSDPTLGACIGIAIGIGMYWSGFKTMSRRKLIMRTPTCTIRSAAIGMCEVIGAARYHEARLTSPFSKKECVYYSYKIEEYRQSGKNSSWHMLKSGSSNQLFFVDDGSGALLIDPSDASVFARVDTTFTTSLFGSNDEHFLSGLAALGLDAPHYFSRRLRAFETWIANGDAVYALGPVQLQKDAAASEINCENLIMCGQKGFDFVLSDKSEKELLSELRWGQILCIFFGPICTLLFLYILLSNFIKG